MMYTETSLLQIQGIDDTPNTGDNSGTPAVCVEALRKEVTQGFLDAHTRANKNAGKALEIASFCYAAIELLEEKGLLSFEELNERQRVVRKRLVARFEDQGVGVVALQEFKQDKYAFAEEVKLDCASRLHLCRAACCRLDLALSMQDVQEGILRWDLGWPYMISRYDDGYCRHLDRAECRCTVWQHRPIPCRGYDCRTDERIWLDFERGTINPDLEEVLSQLASEPRSL